LSLLFMVCALNTTAGPAVKKKKTVVDTMIVMEVNPAGRGEQYHEVTFRRSARHYKLSIKAKADYLKLLKESGKNKAPVLVERADVGADVILSVKRVGKR
jgi:hypothetical protein